MKCIYYHGGCCHKIAGYEPEDCRHKGDEPCFEQETNADHIRSMTDEELAEFLWGFNHEEITQDGFGCFRRYLDAWLKQPYKENDNE